MSEGEPGGSMVSVSASHREGPEFCPQPVYKRHCAEKFRLNITGSPEYTGTDVLVKYVGSKVPTVHAYDVAENSAGFQLRCQPRHLTMDLNYEAYWLC